MSAWNVGDPGLILGSGRSPGEGNGNRLQYPCLEKSHGRRSLEGCSPWSRWGSDTTEQLYFHFSLSLPLNFLPLWCLFPFSLSGNHKSILYICEFVSVLLQSFTCFIFQFPCISDTAQYLSFCVWFILLSIIPSRSVFEVANGKISLFFYLWVIIHQGFPGVSDNKESACNEGNLGKIPGSGRSPGEGNGNPLWYSCLEKSHGRRSLVGYSPWGCKESDTTEWLHFIYFWALHLFSMLQKVL